VNALTNNLNYRETITDYNFRHKKLTSSHQRMIYFDASFFTLISLV